jgi:hypothetical protein
MPKNPPEPLDDVNSDINIFSFVVRVSKEEPASEEEKVGFAPLKPAAFVVIYLKQMAGNLAA